MSALLMQRSVTTVLDMVAAQFAVADSEAVAVSCGGIELSWQKLDGWAWAIANRLATRVGLGDVVPVLTARGGGLVAGWLGALRTGAAYAPLGLDTPAHRLEHIVAELGATTMLVDQAGAALMNALDVNVALIRVEEPARVEGRNRVEEPDVVPGRVLAESVRLTGREPAVVIYTSGTSGRPKGVLVGHRGLLNTALWWADDAKLGRADRLLCTWSTSFDGATFEVFRSLLAGSQLVFADDVERRDPRALGKLLRGPRGATVTSMTPSLLSAVLDADEEDSTTLRTLYVGGEALPRQLAQECDRRWGVPIRNIYGPTEAACISTYAAVDLADDRPPAIGAPLPNTRAYVLGPNQEELPVEVPGELYVAGVGVALGYLGQPERTAAAFLPDRYSDEPDALMYRTGDRVVLRADGLLEYVGRVDDQVKILGHRVEPSEVRKLLEEQPVVRAAAVHAVGEPRRLCAYVELASATPAGLPTCDDVLRPLLSWLPPAVLPADVFVVDVLPLTANDKIDFAALGAMRSTRLPHSTEQSVELTDSQLLAAELFVGVLGETERGQRAALTTGLGPDANFFTLGGHSLLAVRLLAEVERRGLGFVPLRDFLADPTVAGLGLLLGTSPAGVRDSTDVADSRAVMTDRFPATSIQQRLWLIDHVPALRAAYLVPTVVEFLGAVDRDALHRAVASTLERQPALRSRFELDRTVRKVFCRIEGPPPPVTQIDGSTWGVDELREQLAALCWSPFDLAQQPLARAQIIAFDDRTLLVLSVHHIVTDAWSHQLLMDQIVETYRAAVVRRPAILPAPVHPAHLVAVPSQVPTKEGSTNEALTAALSRLRGAPTDVWLPHDRARGAVQGTTAATWATAFGEPLTTRLRAVLGELGCTTFMATAALLAVTLARRSTQRDFLFAFPWGGRETPGSAHAVGMFVNTLVLRVDLTDARTWRELLVRVRESSMSCYRNPDVPFDAVAAALHPDRTLSRPPLTPVYLTAQDSVPRAPELGSEVVSRYLPLHPLHIKYELELTATEHVEDIELVAAYAVDLFDAATISELLAGLVASAADLVQAPDSHALKECLQNEVTSR